MINSKRTEGFQEILEKMQGLITLGPRDFFSIKEACVLLGVSRTHLYEMRIAGKIESRLIGKRKVVITKESIDHLVFGLRDSANQQ